MLTRENTTGLDHHEYDITSPYSVMSHWDRRTGDVDSDVQEDIRNRLQGCWNCP